MKCKGTVVDGEGEIAQVLVTNDSCGKCNACGFGAVREPKTIRGSGTRHRRGQTPS